VAARGLDETKTTPPGVSFVTPCSHVSILFLGRTPEGLPLSMPTCASHAPWGASMACFSKRLSHCSGASGCVA
jgi:hypothetical protein